MLLASTHAQVTNKVESTRSRAQAPPSTPMSLLVLMLMGRRLIKQVSVALYTLVGSLHEVGESVVSHLNVLNFCLSTHHSRSLC